NGHERGGRVRAVGEHGGKQRVAPRSAIDFGGERQQIVGRVLRAHPSEIRHAAKCRIRGANECLDRQWLAVRAIDHHAHRSGDARRTCVVGVAVEHARIVVRARLDERAAVAADSGARGEIELYTPVGGSIHAISQRLGVRRGRRSSRALRGSLLRWIARSASRRMLTSVLFFAMSTSLSVASGSLRSCSALMICWRSEYESAASYSLERSATVMFGDR